MDRLDPARNRAEVSLLFETRKRALNDTRLNVPLRRFIGRCRINISSSRGIIVERVDPLIYAKLLPLQLNTWPLLRFPPSSYFWGCVQHFLFRALPPFWAVSMAFRASRALFIGSGVLIEGGNLVLREDRKKRFEI